MTEGIPLLVKLAVAVPVPDDEARQEDADGTLRVSAVAVTGTINTRQVDDPTADESGDR